MKKRIYITQTLINTIVENGINNVDFIKDEEYVNRLYSDLLEHYKHTDDNFGNIFTLKNNIKILHDYFFSIGDTKKCSIINIIQTFIVDDCMKDFVENFKFGRSNF